MDSQYLKETVGDALIESLSSVLEKQPTDPIEYLGLMLLQYIQNKEGDPTQFPKRDFKKFRIPPKKSVVKQVDVNIDTKESVIRDEVTEKVPLLEEPNYEQVEKAEPRKEFGNETSEEQTVERIDRVTTAPVNEMAEVVLGVDVDISTSEALVDGVTSENVDTALIEQMGEEQVTPVEENTTTNKPIINEMKESESDTKERSLPPQEDLTEKQTTPPEESQFIPVESTE